MPTDLLKRIADRAKALILKPGETWDVIAGEPTDIPGLYKTWIAPLAAIGPIAAFIGMSLIGSGGFGFTIRVPFASGVGFALISFLLTLAAVYAYAWILDQLAPHFGAERNFNQAFKIAAYAPTALWLSLVFLLIPALSALTVVGLYSLYLLFVGLPKLLKPPAEKAGGYTLAAIGAAAVLYIVMWAIASTFAASGPVHITDARGSIMRTSAADRAAAERARTAAPADLEQALGAVLSGAALSGPVVRAEALQALAPDRLAGLRRADVQVSETSVPFPGVTMTAEYGEAGRDQLTLTITNTPALASMMGLMGFAAALDERTADGYRRLREDGDDFIVEEWNGGSETGTYGRTFAGRFFVVAEGRGLSMRDLERAVGRFDARTLERLPTREPS